MKSRPYVGAAIVWAGILLASGILLRGTPYFAQMLPILGGGAVWFVLLVPAAMSRTGGTRPGVS